MPLDLFGDDPLQRAVVIDPAQFLPQGFGPSYADPADGQAAVDGVTKATNDLAMQGQWGAALQLALGVVSKLALGL